jgi:hypothetical protein
MVGNTSNYCCYFLIIVTFFILQYLFGNKQLLKKFLKIVKICGHPKI